MEEVDRGAAQRARVALLLVDLQNSYFEFPELAEVKNDLLERANELIAAAQDAGRPVVLVRTEHERDKSTWTLNMLEDGKGFAYPGTTQASYIDGLEIDECIDLTKTRDNAFHGTRLCELLTQAQISHVLVGGVSTHSCVAETATAAFAHDLHVAIAGQVIASDNATLSESMLEFLSDELRQPVLDQAASVALLREGPNART